MGTSNLFSCDRESKLRVAYGELYPSINAAFNVMTLLGKFKTDDHSIRDLDVVVFLHEKRKVAGASGPTVPAYLIPQTLRYRVRSGEPSMAWTYHAVILDKKNGLVYDVEVGDKPVTAQEHYKMLLARDGEDAAANISIKRLGAHQFLELTEKHGTDRAQMKPLIEELRQPTDAWPEVTLTDLLRDYP